MSATCPQGHSSVATDYCDTCGAPIDASATTGAGAAATPAAPAAATGAPAAGPAASGVPCPNCQAPNAAGALFCEACGYDYTTGALPRVPVPASSLDLDPPGAAATSGSSAPAAPAPASPGPAAPDAAPAPLAPAVPLEWVAEVWVDPEWYAEQESEEPCPSPGLPAIVPLTVRSLLVGRVSHSRNIHPEVDCDGDVGVSRRQAQLSTDGSRWWVEDLQSSNGTYVGPSGGPMPTAALVPGQRKELAEGDRIYVGAWTRIVVRRATEDERSGA